jgi:hypothetical protein
VELLEADQARCAALLENSLAFAYGYAGKIGYTEVERIIAQAGGDVGKIRAALEEAAGNP